MSRFSQICRYDVHNIFLQLCYLCIVLPYCHRYGRLYNRAAIIAAVGISRSVGNIVFVSGSAPLFAPVRGCCRIVGRISIGARCGEPILIGKSLNYYSKSTVCFTSLQARTLTRADRYQSSSSLGLSGIITSFGSNTGVPIPLMELSVRS